MDIGLFLAYHVAREDNEVDDLFDRMLELAVTADNTGFSNIWFPEHHLIRFLSSPSALIPAVQVAQHVKCRVGTAVTVLPFHDPVRFAGEIAAADHATGGRLDLGVARGAYRYEFDTFGLDFTKSLPQFIEVLEAIRALLLNSETSTSFSGEHVNFENAYVWPRPKQAPMPPLWMGAQSPFAVEDAAARGYNVMHSGFFWDDSHITNIAEAFRRGVDRRDNKDAPAPKLMVSRYAAVSESEEQTEESITALIDHWRVHRQLHDYTQTADDRGIVQPLVGEDEPNRDEVRRNLLIGTPAEVAEKVEFYRSVGVDLLTINPAFGVSQAMAMRTVKLFSQASGR